MSNALRWLVIGGGVAGVVLAALLLFSPPEASEPTSPQAPSLVDNPAPNFEVTTLNGETLALSDLHGQAVFLNFWATWCVPCRAEMPAFQNFTTNGPAGAVILAVNADSESAQAVHQFMEEVGAPDVRVGLDPEQDVRALYAVPALPTTYFIDQAGIVRTVRFGEVTEDDLSEFITFLERTNTGQ